MPNCDRWRLPSTIAKRQSTAYTIIAILMPRQNKKEQNENWEKEIQDREFNNHSSTYSRTHTFKYTHVRIMLIVLTCIQFTQYTHFIAILTFKQQLSLNNVCLRFIRMLHLSLSHWSAQFIFISSRWSFFIVIAHTYFRCVRESFEWTPMILCCAPI